MTSLSTLARAARLGAARKRGVTLIEAVLYISIALALIVGGLVFFQQASLAQRTNSAVRNISAIASETRGLYQGSNDFNNFTHATLINAGAVPSSLIGGTPAAPTLTNEWGGTITAGATAAIVGPPAFPLNSGFWVTYPNVPTAACVRLTSADLSGSGRVGSGIRAVTFGPTGPTRITPSSGGATPTEQLDPGDVSIACTNAAVNGAVTITFDFNR
jgi:hypothetical protein